MTKEISKRIFHSEIYKPYFKNVFVIIVEDEAYEFQQLSGYFTDLGIKCINCENQDYFDEKLNEAESFSSDILIVLDMQLKGEAAESIPQLAGYNIIKSLHKNNKNYPIVVVSKHIECLGGAQIRELGVENVLQKSENYQHLADSILGSFLPYFKKEKEKAELEKEKLELEKEKLELEKEKAELKLRIRRSIFHQLSPSLDLLNAELSNLEIDYPKNKKIKDTQEQIKSIIRTKNLEDDINRELNEIGKIEIVAIDLYSFAKWWVDKWTPLDGESEKLEIEIEPEPKKPILAMASENILTLVMNNLATNAAWSMKKKKENKAIISVSLSKNPGFASLSMRDTGTGFDDNVMEKLFKEKISTRTDKENHGTGLRLCYDLVTSALQGFLIPSNITNKNEKLTGAKVEILLPLK